MAKTASPPPRPPAQPVPFMPDDRVYWQNRVLADVADAPLSRGEKIMLYGAVALLLVAAIASAVQL